MRASNLVPPAAKLELTERRRVERISAEAIETRDRAQRFESRLGTVALRNGDRTVESDDRGGTNGQQPVVERHDLSPIRVFRVVSVRMDGGDRCLDVILEEQT